MSEEEEVRFAVFGKHGGKGLTHRVDALEEWQTQMNEQSPKEILWATASKLGAIGIGAISSLIGAAVATAWGAMAGHK